MGEEEYRTTESLLEELRRLSAGLWYISETDAPLEVVHFTRGQGEVPTDKELIEWAGKSAGEAVETVELPYFFRNMTKNGDDAQRFQELQHFMEQQLEEVKVYRVGQRQISALILGKASEGELLGLKTELVET